MNEKKARRELLLLQIKIWFMFLLFLSLFTILFFFLFLSIKEYDAIQVWEIYFALLFGFVFTLVSNYYCLIEFKREILRKECVEAKEKCCPFLSEILKSLIKNKRGNIKIYLNKDEDFNAYCLSLGLPFRSSAILINNGLIKDLLNRRELKAIIAHEIGHIKKIALKEITIKTFSVFSLFMYILLIISPRFEFNQELIKIMALPLPAIFFITLFSKNYFLRQGEFLADLKSVLKTKETNSLINILVKYKIKNKDLKQKNNLFGNEHPSIEERIRRLQKLKNT